MTETRNETRIIVNEDVPMVTIIREFDASPDKVFRAHADPELVARWNGPDSVKMAIDHFDCRTGGSYRFVHTRADDSLGDDFEAWFHGSFHDVVPNELIVQTFTWEGMPEGVALEKLRFEDL